MTTHKKPCKHEFILAGVGYNGLTVKVTWRQQFHPDFQKAQLQTVTLKVLLEIWIFGKLQKNIQGCDKNLRTQPNWAPHSSQLEPNCAGNNEEEQIMRFGLCLNEEAAEAGTSRSSEQENGDGQDNNNYSSFVRYY